MTESEPGLLWKHVREVTMDTPRALGTRAQHHAADYIVEQLWKAGWEVHAQPFTVRPVVSLNDDSIKPHPFPLRFFRKLHGCNLIATPRAAVYGKHVVLSAHYDTVTGSVGADDNASGVAALLEIARTMATSGADISLVFFDREETGMQGAAVWAEEYGAGAGAVINLEMVGYFDDTPGANRVPWIARAAFPDAAAQLAERGWRRDSLLVLNDRRSHGLAATFDIAADAFGMSTVNVSDPRPSGRLRHVATPFMPATVLLELADHAKMWDRKILAITVTSGTPGGTPHYHRPGDTSKTLDYDRLAAVTDAAAAAASMLSGAL